MHAYEMHAHVEYLTSAVGRLVSPPLNQLGPSYCSADHRRL
jgi:hypothetical protein